MPPPDLELDPYPPCSRCILPHPCEMFDNTHASLREDAGFVARTRIRSCVTAYGATAPTAAGAVDRFAVGGDRLTWGERAPKLSAVPVRVGARGCRPATTRCGRSSRSGRPPSSSTASRHASSPAPAGAVRSPPTMRERLVGLWDADARRRSPRVVEPHARLVALAPWRGVALAPWRGPRARLRARRNDDGLSRRRRDRRRPGDDAAPRLHDRRRGHCGPARSCARSRALPCQPAGAGAAPGALAGVANGPCASIGCGVCEPAGCQ